jgi:hypothetical protein
MAEIFIYSKMHNLGCENISRGFAVAGGCIEMKTKNLFGQASFGGLNPQAILIGMAIMVLIVVIVVAFGLVFLANFSAQLTTIGAASSVNVDAAQAAVTTGSTALGSIPGWLPLVILAFILLVILGLIALVAVVASSMQRSGQ